MLLSISRSQLRESKVGHTATTRSPFARSLNSRHVSPFSVLTLLYLISLSSLCIRPMKSLYTFRCFSLALHACPYISHARSSKQTHKTPRSCHPCSRARLSRRDYSSFPHSTRVLVYLYCIQSPNKSKFGLGSCDRSLMRASSYLF